MLVVAAYYEATVVCWGHLFSTYAQRGEGVKQKLTPCLQGGGGLHMEVHSQKRPFLHVFCDTFICWKLYTSLSLA